MGADSGAYISQVNAGSSAEQAGLQQGDIVTELGDTDITSSSDLVLAVRSHNVGDTVTITYVRDGAENTAEVTLGLILCKLSGMAYLYDMLFFLKLMPV